MIGKINLKNPIFRYHNKGYCSIINQVIDIAYEHTKEHKNFHLIIEDDQILNLFDQIYDQVNLNYYDASESWIDKFNSNKLNYKFNAHTEINISFLKERNFIYRNLLKIKKEIKDEFINLQNKFITNKTLGVQLRGTDKKTEIPEIDEQKIISSISGMLQKNNLDDIFLCTDDIKYVNLLKRNFQGIVKYNDKNIVSHDSNPIHFSYDRKEVNKQVLSDVYLLSKCKNFLYCYSNVSFLALTLGIYNFENLELLNK